MQALARLDHPGVVAALDSGQMAVGNPFLVTQYVNGVTLRQEIGMADLLSTRGFHAIVSQIPENPPRYRVLVDPVDRFEEFKLRSALNAAGFPGDQAIRRVF